MSTIGNNIRNIRTERGISQSQLGEAIGKTRSAISQYEAGKIIPRMGAIEDMARVLRVEKTELIRDASYAVVSIPDAGEAELMDIYRSLDRRGRAMLLASARALREGE